ncbi:transcriptional regulator [Actinomadura sp. NAK00032]|uniref:transcriptional regulator n=1 Tax=Actinomadura sp. NAK00032 TaxID=2742128 RepID=UPI00159286C4|nr:transcriptional regulator [Actinomadura sp. NAK00032]QKW38589.1 transcriptional regulator [Actinomadura sp. NAK00032]
MDERVWGEQRGSLDAARARFGKVASSLYPDVPRVADTALLCSDGWVPDMPVPLGDVRLEWEARPEPPAVADPSDGLPAGFRTYAEAMAALAPPKVFEDRPSYRLLDVRLPTLRFGPARYFDGVNVGESVAHELAAGTDAGADAGTDGLPLRTRIGDPCDLTRRPALCAITTLTVTTSNAYVLHWRDPAKVAHAGGLHQVMPVGVFQPLRDEAPDLWKCMVREYSEELLGTAEDYGDGFVQEEWPFHRAMTAARDAGRLRPYFLGLGVDPLTFALDLLTVVVIDAGLFGDLFGGLVGVNDEGTVSMAPFDGTAPRAMQPAGAAALALARRHREALGLTRG